MLLGVEPAAHQLDGDALRELGADVLAFMDAQGRERATLVGHSMGSFMAQQVALAAPEQVAGLVLVGSATEIRKFNGVPELAGVVEQMTDPVPVAFIREFQASTVYRPVPDAFMQRVVAESQKLPAHAWKALLAGFLATPRADGLRARAPRTLIVWGEHDAFAPRAEQQTLQALIPGAVLKSYPDVAHTPQWEQPAEFAGDLIGFLEGQPAS